MIETITKLMTPEFIALLSLIVSSFTAIVMAITGYYMRKLEKNTNSIKDELVIATAQLNYAAGVIEGKRVEKEQTQL